MNAWCRWGGVWVVGLAAAVVGCAGADDGAEVDSQSLSGSEDGADSADSALREEAPAQPLLVRLKEFSVTPARDTVRAGAIRFMVLNKGTEFHEFVVVKTDLSIAELPTNPDGSFDEEGAGVEVIDEIEEIDPGQMERLTLTLEAGHYVILCNRVEIEDGEVESHFAEGMVHDLEVQ